MEYRNFNLKEKVSLLGFGAMRLPTKNEQIDVETANKMIDLAFKSGVTYFDTAYFYHNGESESFLGQSLKRYPRDSFAIATKMPMGMVKSLDQAKEVFQTQLKRLQMDYINFYLLHAINKQTYLKAKDLGIITFINELKQQGIIKHFGFSFHGSFEDFCFIIDDYKFDFVQIQLNYMDINHQQGIKGYEILKARKIPVIIMEPVKGGALAHLSPSETEIFKSYHPNKSIASWAIRYIATLDGVLTLLSGMSTLEQVEDNLNTINHFTPLNQKEQELILSVAARIKKRILVPCTDCRYCLPCPFNVNIPLNFKILNELYQYDNLKQWPNVWGIKNEEKLDKCQTCHLCEAKCPQKIKISDIFTNIKLKNFTSIS